MTIISQLDELTVLAFALALAGSSLILRLVTKRASIVVLLVAAGAGLAFGPPGVGFVAGVIFASSLVTLYKYSAKSGVKIAEGNHGARGFWKVLAASAAGGIAAWLALSGILSTQLGKMAFVAALGTVVSDTFASELGVLSKKKPRLIVPPWATVESGVSGAVSILGEIAGLAGVMLALGMAVLAALLPTLKLALVVGLSIVSAEHLDSLLGSTAQEAYYCTKCSVLTDSHVHDCGCKTSLVRGNVLVSNSLVNLISTSTSSVLAIILFIVL